MKSIALSRVGTNLILIAVIVPIAWMGLTWLEARLLLGPSNSPYQGSALALNVLTLVPQMLLAGLLQQGVLVALPRKTPRVWTRLIAMIAGLAFIVLVMAVVGGGALGIVLAPDVALALVIAVVVYVTVMRLPLRKSAT